MEIARACDKKIRLAARQGVDLVVILLDREVAAHCSGEHAKDIEHMVASANPGLPRVRVVLKDSTFENWLIADLEALRGQPGRYTVSESMRKKIEPGKADGCDGYELLRAASKGAFHKVHDAVAICERLDPVRAAAHSRSFRHFLHVIGDPAYPEPQCRRPVVG
jgi:hypothetical protein